MYLKTVSPQHKFYYTSMYNLFLAGHNFAKNGYVSCHS